MKISEIARLAGVSSAAVSRYINGGSISEEKKQRIKKVIEETGYVPNPNARSLRQQRNDGIGVIVPKFNSDSVSNLIEGVSTVLSKSGYLAVFGNAENDEKRELEYMRLMQETRFAGILLMGTVFTPKHIAFFRESKMPIVVCGQNHPSVTCVYHDDKGAAKEIIRYMIEKGRRKLAYIGVIERDISVGINRRQVFFTVDDGYKGMNDILDGGYVPDGVICATDTLAVGAIKALQERGYKVPDDISVAGIGGGFAGTIITPALTTVKLFHRECGERGARLLLSMIEQQREKPDQKLPTTHTMFGYSLIERESV